MMRSARAEPRSIERTGPFPVRIFAVALAVVIAVVGALLWNLLVLQRHTDEFHTRHRALADAIARIRLADQALTTSARLLVITGEPEHQQRYREFLPQLTDAFDRAGALIQDPEGEWALRRAAEVTARLVAIESHAIRFAAEGRAEEALDLLVGPEYLGLERRLQDRLVTAVARMRVEEQEADREERVRRLIGLALGVGSIPAVTVVWFLLLRGVRRWSADRRRAERHRRESESERRRLLGHIVRAQEEERRRIAADIHDDSIQALTAVSLRIDILRRGTPDTEGLDHLSRTVEEAIRRLRHLMFELHPRVLDRDGLGAAVRESLQQVSADGGFSYELVDEVGPALSTEVRVIAYRIVREALANIRKHARARTVRVELGTENGHARIVVRDDGVGFVPDRARESPLHLGLATMRERAEVSGGRLEVDSRPGRGTTVRVEIPLSPSDPAGG